jgi:hypothetical protein
MSRRCDPWPLSDHSCGKGDAQARTPLWTDGRDGPVAAQSAGAVPRCPRDGPAPRRRCPTSSPAVCVCRGAVCPRGLQTRRHPRREGYRPRTPFDRRTPHIPRRPPAPRGARSGRSRPLPPPTRRHPSTARRAAATTARAGVTRRCRPSGARCGPVAEPPPRGWPPGQTLHPPRWWPGGPRRVIAHRGTDDGRGPPGGRPATQPGAPAASGRRPSVPPVAGVPR